MILWLRRISIEKMIKITMNGNNKQNSKMRENKSKKVNRVEQ